VVQVDRAINKVNLKRKRKSRGGGWLQRGKQESLQILRRDIEMEQFDEKVEKSVHSLDK